MKSIKTINDVVPNTLRPLRFQDLQNIWDGLACMFAGDSIIGDAYVPFRVLSGFYVKIDGSYSAGCVAFNGQLWYHPDTDGYRIFPNDAVYATITPSGDLRVFDDATTRDMSFDNVLSTSSTGGTLVGTFSRENVATYRVGWINDRSITYRMLASDSVSIEQIRNGAVTTDKLAEGAVTYNKMGSDSVSTEQIRSGAVTTDKLVDGSVTAGKMAVDSVGNAQLQAGAVTYDKVTSIHGGVILGDTINAGAIVPRTIDASRIAIGAVGTNELADGGVIAAKISSVNGATLFAGSVQGTALADRAVSRTKIALQAVGIDELANGAVTDAKIATGAVTLNKLQTFPFALSLEMFLDNGLIDWQGPDAVQDLLGTLPALPTITSQRTPGGTAPLDITLNFPSGYLVTSAQVSRMPYSTLSHGQYVYPNVSIEPGTGSAIGTYMIIRLEYPSRPSNGTGTILTEPTLKLIVSGWRIQQ